MKNRGTRTKNKNQEQEPRTRTKNKNQEQELEPMNLEPNPEGEHEPRTENAEPRTTASLSGSVRAFSNPKAYEPRHVDVLAGLRARLRHHLGDGHRAVADRLLVEQHELRVE